jgi:hypothetical protein
MRTTIDLDPTAHRLAKILATQRNVSLGTIVSEAIMERYRAPETTEMAISIGRPITSEEVRELIEED